ncbi:DUF4365 domain-containing protein (plasmid) [Cetobacterium somerae]|uniref:DUF4365 domain-containing protein n=1 Tax=Cetobacterium somerae TaxID=188913 RepID=UPI001F061757|nr:DUF4365 domain-containing protein [Cetobacterium somerae]UPO99048.1 DUF4365 domain-containing protein [Cetobacterium somerae]
MKSEYSSNQILERKSIHYIEGKCINLKWKYRQYDQDNDVDGEIEIFEEEESLLKNITKSNYIKVQLKAQQKVDKNEKFVRFSLKTKFIKFIKECQVPLILIVYDESEEKGYWVFLQRYYRENNLDESLNQLEKTIYIPIENTLEDIDLFKNEMLKLSEDGLLEILLENKKINLNECYEIIETKDISYAGRVRKTMSVYINNLFLKNEYILNKLLIRLENEHIKNDINFRESNKLVDELTIFVYNSLIKIGNFAALFRYEVINNNGKYNRALIDLNKLDYNIETYSKGEYLQIALISFLEATKITTNLYNLNNVKTNIIKYEKDIEEIYFGFIDRSKIAPLECKKLDESFLQYISLLDNFKFYKEDHYNDYYINKKISELKLKEIEVIDLMKKQIQSIYI